VFDALSFFKPVELSEYGCDVFSSLCARYNARSENVAVLNIGLVVPYKMVLH